MIDDRENIANKFNVFFTNVGEKIAKGINYDGNKNYSHYLNKEIHSSFTLMNIDEAAINKIIYNLPPKSSSGCDRAGTNTPSDEYDTYRDTGWRIRYVSRIHFFSEAKLGNG